MSNRLSAVFSVLVLVFLFSCKPAYKEGPVTIGSLLDEMVSLKRLTFLPEPGYRTIQFSSYDRRSQSPSDSGWFANEDGFGGEPLPGFEEVIKEPDSTGIGEYLICDIQSPGVIQRLWTASITGSIRFFLDDADKPVYEGAASEFFWNPLNKLAGITDSAKYAETFRQFDATYLPVPFASRCRIEWIGNIREPHFYHVGVRVYKTGVKVEPFSAANFSKYVKKLDEVNSILVNPEDLNPAENEEVKKADLVMEPNAEHELFKLKGSEAIVYFKVKVKAEKFETALRQTVLTIYFDDKAVPQVQAPLGDFFGAAPGLNPFKSLPFSVMADSSFICRFVMPFKTTALFRIENHSSEEIILSSVVRTVPYEWQERKSMYFMARWKISHGLTAHNSESQIEDIPYLKAVGTGRLVGAAAYLYNPAGAPTSWGNWWGEGDEKIFVDRDTFPSFFGTGSEDYFNYSWSSPKIFSNPYCGQPRNDGPNNRGYVANFRWHIADDITFYERLDFYMELRHHDIVPDFSYGRIVYFYALPSLTDDYKEIESDDIRNIPYYKWSPKAYLGCAGYRFIQAEKLVVESENIDREKGNLWSEEVILTWKPKMKKEKLKFVIRSDESREKTRIGFTMAHTPSGATLTFLMNGKPVKFDNKELLDLSFPYRTVLDNHFSELLDLKKGDNELLIGITDADGSQSAQIDFVWLRF